MTDPTPKSAPRTCLYLLPLVALFAILPLMVRGCSCGHDFDFHLLSWFEAASQIAHGTLHPHWAFTPAWNAGEPRFVFYPPLSWFLGALLGMILPWTWTPIVYTWFALTGAGFSCYYLLRDFAPVRTALLFAALYTVNPYMLFTAYERTAYAELLCAAWLPLLLHGILRERVTITRIAIPLALVWLTNAPAAVLATYSLALLAATRLFTVGNDQRSTFALTTLGGTVLGLGLTGFYVIPAAYERRFVESSLDRAQSALITTNFLFGHTADPAHDAVLHTASLLAIGLLLASAAALLIAFLQEWERGRVHRRVMIALACLTATIAFLLTPLSTPVWLNAPELAFLQFPWRFLAILTPALALLLALAFGAKQLKGLQESLATTVLVILFTLTAFHAFYQPCDDEDSPAARLALFHSPLGTEGTDEYTISAADDDALAHANPPFWLAEDPDAPAAANASPEGPLRPPVTLTSPTARALILNLRDYPAWRVFRNGSLVPTRMEREDGLIAIPVPAGQSTVTLTYAHTRDQTAGDFVTGISLAAMLYLLFRRRRR